MRIVLLLVVAGLKEGELQPWMRLCILWEFKNIRIIPKNIRNCDTGSDTRFDSNLVNILVKNNLVNNLVVHSC